MTASATQIATDPPALFLRQKQVLEIVPITDTTLWRWVKAKKFPQPIKLGPRTTAWRVSDVEAWARGFNSVSN